MAEGLKEDKAGEKASLRQLVEGTGAQRVRLNSTHHIYPGIIQDNRHSIAAHRARAEEHSDDCLLRSFRVHELLNPSQPRSVSCVYTP